MQNLDQTEINKFAAIAHNWWDENSEFKPLHAINPLRLNWINSQTNLSGKKVLDIGCGGGILSESMAKCGAQVTGIDLGEDALNIAKLHQLESGLTIDYQCISAEEFAAQNANQFDVVTCLEMLEHVPNPESIIKSCYQLVKPSGYVFFSTINRNPKSYVMAILGAEYILKILPIGTHDFSKFITPAELSSWCRKHQLTIKQIIGLSYNPLINSYKLTDDVCVNYMLSVQKNV